jgi:ankyrin repeat protein
MTGHTLLTAAIKIPSFILVKACLERGEELNERGGNGFTPLLAAVQSWESWIEDQNLDLLRMLIEKGADVTAQDPDGNTALDVLVRKRVSKAAKFLAKNGATVSETHIELLPILQEGAVEEEEVVEENHPLLAILWWGSETEE